MKATATGPRVFAVITPWFKFVLEDPFFEKQGGGVNGQQELTHYGHDECGFFLLRLGTF